jgi:hypothetical protein
MLKEEILLDVLTDFENKSITKDVANKRILHLFGCYVFKNEAKKCEFCGKQKGHIIGCSNSNQYD